MWRWRVSDLLNIHVAIECVECWMAFGIFDNACDPLWFVRICVCVFVCHIDNDTASLMYVRVAPYEMYINRWKPSIKSYSSWYQQIEATRWWKLRANETQNPFAYIRCGSKLCHPLMRMIFFFSFSTPVYEISVNGAGIPLRQSNMNAYKFGLLEYLTHTEWIHWDKLSHDFEKKEVFFTSVRAIAWQKKIGNCIRFQNSSSKSTLKILRSFFTRQHKSFDGFISGEWEGKRAKKMI